MDIQEGGLETTVKKRHRIVDIIGLISIAYAVKTVGSGLWFFIANLIHGADSLPIPIGVLVGDVIIGICIGYLGLRFLKLRAWTRLALGVVVSIVLMVRIASGIWWLLKWPDIMQRMSDASISVDQSLVSNLFSLIAWNIIPLIAIIWLLQTKAVKEAFAQSKA
jgi:hypothetical protein